MFFTCFFVPIMAISTASERSQPHYRILILAARGEKTVRPGYCEGSLALLTSWNNLTALSFFYDSGKMTGRRHDHRGLAVLTRHLKILSASNVILKTGG